MIKLLSTTAVLVLVVLLLHVVNASVTIIAGGSTAASGTVNGLKVLYNEDTNNTFSYDGVGSGGGVSGLLSGKYLFAFSENALTATQKNVSEGLRTIPLGALGIPVIYNLGGLEGVVLDRSTLVAIFNGTIENWQDERILKLQSEQVAANMPNATILKVFRDESSGTTTLFSTALGRFNVAFREFNSGRASFSTWPTSLKTLPNFLGANGNGGLGKIVAENFGAIGYGTGSPSVNSRALLKNKVGRALSVTFTTVSNAVQDNILELERRTNANHLEGDLIDGDGRYSYPICGYTYAIFDININGTLCESALAMYDLMATFIYSEVDTVGQTIVKDTLGIPFNSKRAQSILDEIQCGDKLLSEMYWGKLKKKY